MKVLMAQGGKMNKLNINDIIPILQKMKKGDLLIVDEGLGRIIFNPDRYTLMKLANIQGMDKDQKGLYTTTTLLQKEEVD